MAKNEETIESLQKKLDRANGKIRGLERKVHGLELDSAKEAGGKEIAVAVGVTVDKLGEFVKEIADAGYDAERGIAADYTRAVDRIDATASAGKSYKRK